MGNRRQISMRGTLIELAGGGCIRALPQSDNLPYQEKFRQLHAAKREELGLDADADLGKVLTYSDMAELMARATIGPVIRWWDGFDDEEGNPIPSHDEAGNLLEDNGVKILLFPGVSSDFAQAMKAIDGRHAREVETLVGEEGNSSRPSAGISGTEAT